MIVCLSESEKPNRLTIRFVQKSVIGRTRSVIRRSAIPLTSVLFVVIVSIVLISFLFLNCLYILGARSIPNHSGVYVKPAVDIVYSDFGVYELITRI